VPDECIFTGRMAGPFPPWFHLIFKQSGKCGSGPKSGVPGQPWNSCQRRKREGVKILVNTSNVAAVKHARNRRTAARINLADHLAEKGWLQERYRYGDLSRLWYHLINTKGVITISTSSSLLETILYCP